MTAYTYDDLYVINYTDIVKGTITIPKAAVITDILDVTLLGKSLLNYGEIFDENVLHILENFACPQIVPPISGVITPDLSQVNVEKPSGTPLLSHPTVGQLWFNKTDNHLYVFDTDGIWAEVKLRNDITANNGIVAHGQLIPLPAGIISYDQCSVFLSPQYLDDSPNYMVCYPNATVLGSVTTSITAYMRYRPANSTNMVDGLANYIIIGNIVPETHYHPVVSVTPTLTAAPVLTSTPTNTVTPTKTPAPAVTVTPTISFTPTPTLTLSATLTGTPVITPSPTAVPTPTPTGSPINYAIFNMIAGADSRYDPSSGHTASVSGFFLNNDIVQGTTVTVGSISPATDRFNGLTVNMVGWFQPYFGTAYFFFSLLSPNNTVPIPANPFSQVQFTDQFGIFRTYTFATAEVDTIPFASGTQVQYNWNAPSSSLFAAGVSYTILVYP